jgi:REP element-mobilizing transposase RayT
VSFCKSPVNDKEIATVICQSIEETTRILNYKLYGYCVMPNHVHILLSPAESGISVGRWLQKFKSFTGHVYAKRNNGLNLWQRSAYDHICREHETAEAVLRYIVNNPVRVGLVDDWTKWLWTRYFIEI